MKTDRITAGVNKRGLLVKVSWLGVAAALLAVGQVVAGIAKYEHGRIGTVESRQQEMTTDIAVIKSTSERTAKQVDDLHSALIAPRVANGPRN